MGFLPFEQEARAVVVRRHAETSPNYGCRPEERPLAERLQCGIIILDKPAGPSSHQVSAYLQKILGLKKSGHAGTLDPKVTGVLPVGLGRGTRIVHSLLVAGKEYVALMHLHKPSDEYKVRKLLAEFQGTISQLPPVKSAVKRQLRERTIYYIELLDIQGQDVLFKAGTQAGTYIRKLCHDMGLAAKDDDGKPSGAHMAELRRTKAGPFNETVAVTLQDVTDAFHYYENGDPRMLNEIVLPVERGVAHLKKIWVLDSAVDPLCNGVRLKVPGISKLHDNISPGDMVAVLTLKDELVLVGKAALDSHALLGGKGVAVVTEQVFLPSGTYPKNE